MLSVTDRPASLARAGRWIAPLAGGFAVAGGLVLLAALALWIGHAPGWAFDFNAYQAAALRVLAIGSPYQPETLLGPFQPIAQGLYLYSPVPAIAFIPIAALPANQGAIVWLVLRLAALGAMCALMPVSRPVRAAAFGVSALSFPVMYDLNLGNVSIVVAFLTTIGWRGLNQPAGGAAVALATLLRPTSVLIGLAWLVTRSWRALAGALISGIGLVCLTLPFVGSQGWLDYITLLRNVSAVTGLEKNADLASAVLRMGAGDPLPSIAFVAGAAVALVAVVLAARRERELGYVVAAIAGLLMAPVLWAHYLTLLVLPAAFLAHRGRAWAIALPLLGWLPQVALPFVVILAVSLPFLAKPPKSEESASVLSTASQ